MPRNAAFVLVSVLSAGSCSDPSADAPKARVEAASPAAPDAKASPAKTGAARHMPREAAQVAAPGVETVEVQADPASSRIRFVGSKVTASHDGTFRTFSARATLAGETPQDLQVEVDVSSLAAEPEKLRAHLLSEDFFAADAHPKATFHATRIEPAPEGEATHRITGDLTLRGVTKRISFPARIEISPGKVTGRARFSINRKDFGIEYPGLKDDLIRDDVLLEVDLVFPRGAPNP